MGEIIIAKFLHYKGHWLALLALVLAVTDYVAQHVLEAQAAQSIFSIAIRLEMLMTHVICSGIWIAVAVAVISIIYYSDATGGRSLWADRRDYHRTMFELIRDFEDSDPFKMKQETLPVESWKNAVGVILGHVGSRLIYRSTWAHNMDGANFALFALPGAGKTAAQIIPSAMRYGGSVFCIDIKGDVLRAVKGLRRVKIFAPADPAHSEHYNPLAGVAKLFTSKRITFFEQMSRVLIPDEHGGDSKYFVEGARDLFCGVALHLVAGKPNITLPELARHILRSNAIDWIKLICEGSCVEAIEFASGYYGQSEKNLSGVWGELCKAVRPFATGELAEILTDNSHCISPETLDEGYDVYIEIPQEMIQVLAPVTSLITQNFMRSFESRPDKTTGERLQPVLFLLDEFPQLSLDPVTLSAALSTLRSKSVSVFLAQQSIGQLKKRYGDDGTREIIDTCAYISVMSAQDPESRDFFQKLFGTKKVLKKTSNDSSGGSFWRDYQSQGNSSRGAQEDREPVIRAEEFGNLGDKVAIYADGEYVIADKCWWFK